MTRLAGPDDALWGFELVAASPLLKALAAKRDFTQQHFAFDDSALADLQPQYDSDSTSISAYRATNSINVTIRDLDTDVFPIAGTARLAFRKE